MDPVEKVRIDKWLWSIRLFKSRTLATDALREGKVRINGLAAKPSSTVGVGDIVSVKKDGFNLQYRALQLIEKRVGAPIAATCYEDLTPAEELNKYKVWFETGQVTTTEGQPAARPGTSPLYDTDNVRR